ncbi:alpha/beta fold hydrolase [Micromonospora sp. R77]|nr:alpha/beta fold hydrolase [Micromonospora sp. R77]MCI4066541.1 alpha/beta fold hydrolase [Micromonospora sp. R77]
MTGTLPAADELTVAGRRMRCRITGDGPPVVLLHGIGRTLDDFTAQQELLAADHRVLSVDLPGHGGSAPLDVPHTLPALAAAVADFLDAAGVSWPARLVGNSSAGRWRCGSPPTRRTGRPAWCWSTAPGSAGR